MRFGTGLARTAATLATVVGVVAGLTACAPDVSVPIGAPPQAEGPLPEETRAALEESVRHAMAASGASGAIVGVWVPWSGTWVTGLGTQAVGAGEEVSTDMRFRVGDATRPMICDVLYAVAAEGTVSLEDSVTDYVSAVPDLADVSLLDLCNGTSGIGSYQGLLQSMWINNPEREWNPRELAAFGLGRPRTAEPGQTWRDSDAGYILLGIALERATRTSAGDLLERYVFDPLDLENTTLPDSGSWQDAGPALHGLFAPKSGDGRDCIDQIDVTAVSTTTGYTDSGVVSTIEDLGRYTQALASGALGSEGQERWERPLPTSASAPSWYTSTGGAFLAGSLVGQAGAVPGYTTAAYADPDTGMTVAVVLNNSAAGGSIGNYLAWELAAIASKAAAASGQSAPEFGLPWTAEQYHAAIADAAICPPSS